MDEDIKLGAIQKLKLKLFGRVFIGKEIHPGWKDYIPFYVFRCPEHGLVKDYPHGYRNRLDCPRCVGGSLKKEFSV